MTPKKAKKNTDPTWNHCVRVLEPGQDEKDMSRLKLKCKYCEKELWGGVIRMKHHLARTKKNVAECKNNPEDVVKFFKKLLDDLAQKNEFEGVMESFDQDGDDGEKSKGGISRKGKGAAKQSTITSIVKDRTPVCLDICRFFYAHALPFHLVKSPFFHKMMESAMNYGKGLKLPSYHEIRVPFLKKEVQNVYDILEKYKNEWKKTGCTLMSDGWTDGKQRSITNFLVNSPKGTVFLKSVDTSSIIKDADNLCELLDSMVEEIGEEHVVQVCTDSAAAYVSAGAKLMEKRKNLFWSPCAAHCIDLMLSDIGELRVHKETLEKAKTVTVYIYRHAWVLDLMRRFTKKRDLARPGVTRFATSYLTLRAIVNNIRPLRAMFSSDEWAKSSYAKKSNGKRVKEIILGDSHFLSGVKYCLKGVLPLVKVLRLVDGDAKPPMGYIYEAVDRAKEQIEKNFNYVQSRYAQVWKIIDDRWLLQLHRPLHAAGYFLNPKFHYATNFNADMEVKLGLYRTIERMFPDLETRLKIDQQLDKFNNAEGMFGMDMAVITREKKHPALWWESYGSGCPELQKLAMRVLSLSCSASGCERNWSIFDCVHSKKRNRLEQQRLNALVFVKYNLNLESRQKKRQENGDSYDPICLSDMESDDEWITEKEDPCLPEDTSWMDVHECFNEVESSNKRKRGPRNLQDDVIGKRATVVQEDDDLHEIEVIADFDNEEGFIDDDGRVVGDDEDDYEMDIDFD